MSNNQQQPGYYVPPGAGGPSLPSGAQTVYILAYACFFLPALGPVVWYLARAELRRMDAGKVDPSARGGVNACRIIGAILSWMFVAALVAMIALVVLSFSLPMIMMGARASDGYTSTGRIRAVFPLGEEDEEAYHLETRVKAFVSSMRTHQKLIDEHSLYQDLKREKNMTVHEVRARVQSKIASQVTRDEIELGFQHRSREKAQAVCKSLIDDFLPLQVAPSSSTANAKLKVVDARLASLQGEISTLEDRLAELGSANADHRAEVEASRRRLKTQLEPLREEQQDLDARKLRLQAELAGGETGTRFVIIDPCRLPTSR